MVIFASYHRVKTLTNVPHLGKGKRVGIQKFTPNFAAPWSLRCSCIWALRTFALARNNCSFVVHATSCIDCSMNRDSFVASH